jgi:nitrate/nitrite transporter NarK
MPIASNPLNPDDFAVNAEGLAQGLMTAAFRVGSAVQRMKAPRLVRAVGTIAVAILQSRGRVGIASFRPGCRFCLTARDSSGELGAK